VVQLPTRFDAAEQMGWQLAVLLALQIFGERRPEDRQFHL
jgi:hypothetical protein